jgi:multidrug resistance protein MdtO
MATVASTISPAPNSLAWLRTFIRDELAPYPGRGALVARMVVTATIVMVINMTFQIPYGAYGAVYALTLSRESPHATLKDARVSATSFALAVLYTLVGAVIFAGEPILRLVWVLGTLFLIFFALRVIDYRAAARFGYLTVIAIPLWDRQIRAEEKVTETLWAVAAISLSMGITSVVELVYARLYPMDNLTSALVERLLRVAGLLRSLANGVDDPETKRRVARLAILGTSRMRRDLTRSDRSPDRAARMRAVVALVGRLVDLVANLPFLSEGPGRAECKVLEQLANRITALADGMLGRIDVRQIKRNSEDPDACYDAPLLREIGQTVTLIEDVMSGSDPGGYSLPSKKEQPQSQFLAPDAFSNPAHLRFAIRGGLAASLCYLTYNLIAWPGISTSITTCLLTALTTVGSSRQKQILRFGGALVGGVILGFSSQVFILPAIDSIAGFVLLFVAVTTLAAWIATSGPRLSYFGVQVAVAFYLINLQEFKFQTSLAVARDRVMGIFLGLLAMWTVFDQLWGSSALVEMQRTFLATLRLMAKLMRAPISAKKSTAVEETYSLRESIDSNFEALRSQADGVMLEFGGSRGRDLAMRSRILDWQIQLRVIFIVRIALLKYRLNLSGFELPEDVLRAQKEFDEGLAARFDKMADRVSGADYGDDAVGPERLHQLESRIEESSGMQAPGMNSVVSLRNQIQSLVATLDGEIMTAK